jgi:hypothetical protein
MPDDQTDYFPSQRRVELEEKAFVLWQRLDRVRILRKHRERLVRLAVRYWLWTEKRPRMKMFALVGLTLVGLIVVSLLLGEIDIFPTAPDADDPSRPNKLLLPRG